MASSQNLTHARQDGMGPMLSEMWGDKKARVLMLWRKRAGVPVLRRASDAHELSGPTTRIEWANYTN